MFRIPLLYGFLFLIHKSTTTFLEVGNQQTTWPAATQTCTGRMVGGYTMNSCQPQSCDPYSLKGGMDGADVRGQIMWLDGYVLRSPLMEYFGCYIGADIDSIHQVKYETFSDNGVLVCSRYCKWTGMSNPGDFILLSSNRCYCISKKHHELFNTWGGVPFKRNVTSLCNLPCPGDDDDRCGSLEKPSSESEIILTVYIFVQEQIDPTNTELGQYCYVLEPEVPPDDLNRRPVNRISCEEKIYVKCDMEDEPADNVLIWSTKCYDLHLNWYEAQRQCQNNDSQLQTSHFYMWCNKLKDVNSNRVWHNRFVKEKIVWNTDITKPQDASCLTLQITDDGGYKLSTHDCGETHPALCESITDVSVTNVTTGISTTKSNYAIIFMALSLVILTIAGIIIATYVYRKQQKKSKQIPNASFNPDVTGNVQQESTEYAEVNYSDMDEDSPLSLNDIDQIANEYASTVDQNGTSLTAQHNTGLLSTDDQGYSNPYQILTEGWQSRPNLYASTSQPTEQNTGLEITCDEEYINPYQILTEGWQSKTNVYASISQSTEYVNTSERHLENETVVNQYESLNEDRRCSSHRYASMNSPTS